MDRSDRPVRDRIELPLDEIADPVFRLDSKNRFVRVNDAVIEYTGYDREELLGYGIDEILPASADERLRSRLGSRDDDGRGTETLELPVCTDDGERLTTEAHVTVLTDERGRYTGAVGVLRDVSERDHRERELALFERLVSRAFRHSVHDELSVVRGHVELLEERIEEDCRSHTRTILERVDRLAGRSEKLRHVESIIDAEEPTAIDIADVVETVVDPARATHPQAAIEADVPAGATVYALPEIEDALGELLDNAIEHAPEDTPARIEVRFDREADDPVLFVEDESGGISPHEMAILRDGRPPKHGDGLGLWLVRWFATASGGDTIAQRTDQGTLIGLRFGDHGDGKLPIDVGTDELDRQGIRRDGQDGDRGVIGHDQALDQLEAVYERLEYSGARTVLLTGEAGIGKTTLVEQFSDRCSRRDPRPAVATGTCDRERQSPYDAFKQLLAAVPVARDPDALFGDTGDGSIEDADELEQRRRALFADVAEELRAVGRRRPTVLVLEDLHWADSATVALFEHLVDELGREQQPILLLGTYRKNTLPEAHPVRDLSEEIAGAERGTVIELEPFDEQDVRSLISRTLGRPDLPDAFVDELYDHTGGTPLFVDAVGRHLAERLSDDRTATALPETLSDVAVPETVGRAITDRIDALSSDVRPVLRLGAVIGREVSFDVLRAASDRPLADLVDSIDTLVERGIWRRSTDGIEFVHGVIRDRTLASIPDTKRGALHGRVANAIEDVHADAIEEYAARLGDDYVRVGEYDTAFGYYRRAGEYATETYAHGEAIDHYERALSLVDDHDAADPGTATAVSTDLGNVFELLGEYDAAWNQYERSLDRRREREDRAGEAANLHDLGRTARLRGEYDAARTYHERSLDIYRELGDRAGEADCRQGLGRTAFRQGAYGRAREQLERSLEIRREIGDRAGEAQSLHNLGNVALRRAEYDRAVDYYKRSLEIKREIGDRQGEAATLNNLGTIATHRGEYTRGQEYYERGLEIKREIGDRKGEGTSLHNLGILAEYQGEYNQAREYYERSLVIDRETGDRSGEAKSLHNLGTLAFRRADYDRAIEYYERSLEIQREIGDRQGEATGLHYLGQVSAERGEYDRAIDYYEGSLEIKREIGDRQGEAASLRGLGAVALGHDDFDTARKRLTGALEIARSIDAAEPEISSLRGLGALARKREEYDRSERRLEAGLDACDEHGDHRHRVRILLEQARLDIERDDIESADATLQRIEELLTEHETTHEAARATLLRGRVEAASGSIDDAREHWRRAHARFEELGAHQDRLAALRLLVEACRAENDRQAANDWRDRAETAFEAAPDPVQKRHQDWLGEG